MGEGAYFAPGNLGDAFTRDEDLDKVETVEEKVRAIYEPVMTKREPVRDPAKMVELLRKEFKLIVDYKVVALTVSAFLIGRPVLFEGPPGTGKTEIGEAILTLWAGKPAFILPCSENYDEYRVIGDFHPLMAMKYGFNEKSFIPRPLLAALILDAGVLVDEIRRSSEEFQNMLLDIIDKRRIVVPELRQVFRAHGPGFQVIFTSNPEDVAQGELSDAFLRRVVRIKFDYPPPQLEKEIVLLRLEGDARLPSKLLDKMIEAVNLLRRRASYKPGPADTVLWAQLAVRMASLRGSQEVELQDVIESAYVALGKRVEEEELVSDVLRQVFGGNA